MSVYNLDKIFKPDSVAVIGASEKEGSIGSALMQNLNQGGFQVTIIPVNPKRSTICRQLLGFCFWEYTMLCTRISKYD
jgi:acetyltransferase